MFKPKKGSGEPQNTHPCAQRQRDENGRFTSKKSGKPVSKIERSDYMPPPNMLLGQFVYAVGSEAHKNLYLISIFKAFWEFLCEERKGQCCTELRFVEKWKAANRLFPEAKQSFVGSNVEILSKKN
jgi:hypothetical protein